MDNNSLSHTTWNCKYHIVFNEKNCHNLIEKNFHETSIGLSDMLK